VQREEWILRRGCGLGALRKDGKSDSPPPLIAGRQSFHDQFTKASPGLREVKTACVCIYMCASMDMYIVQRVYIHASGFRPVVGLIYSDIVSANGNLSPENPPYTVLYIISVRPICSWCCSSPLSGIITLLYIIYCGKQHGGMNSIRRIWRFGRAKSRLVRNGANRTNSLNIFFPMETT